MTEEEFGGHDAFTAALSGAEPADAGGGAAQGQDAGQGGSPPAGGGAGDAGQGQQPQPGGEGASTAEPQSREDAMVPSWRLREISEQREAERRERAEERRQAEAERRELEQYRQHYQRQRAEDERAKQEAALKGEDFYASQDPNAFIDKRVEHQLQQILGPVRQNFEQMQAAMVQETRERSRLFVEQQFGADAVQKAIERSMARLRAGDPDTVAFDRRFDASRNPFGEMMALDKRLSLLETTKGDLEGYTKAQREAAIEEALKDPAFLQRALEASRQQATPVQTGVPGRSQPASPPRGSMPSVNRATGASGDGSGGASAEDVFAEEIARRGRPPG